MPGMMGMRAVGRSSAVRGLAKKSAGSGGMMGHSAGSTASYAAQARAGEMDWARSVTRSSNMMGRNSLQDAFYMNIRDM